MINGPLLLAFIIAGVIGLIRIFRSEEIMPKSSEFSLQNVTSGRPSTTQCQKVLSIKDFLPSGL